MTNEEAKRKTKKHGVYRLNWKTGGSSLAAVGGCSNGDLWFAPANWQSELRPPAVVSTNWNDVESVELIAENDFSVGQGRAAARGNLTLQEEGEDEYQ